MAEHRPDTLRGVLVPFDWATIDTANTDLTERSPRAGTPEAQQASAMAVQASGTQSSGTRRVQVKRGGYPAQGAATFVWDDNDGDWRGWNVPSAIHQWEPIAVETSTASSTIGEQFPDVVTLADGSLLMVTCENDGTDSIVRAYTGDPGTTAWSSATTVHSETADPDGTGAHSFMAHPCLAVTPSGRVLCFFATYGPNDAGQIRLYTTDDNGATWTEGQRYVLPTSADTSTKTLNRFAAACNRDGQVLIVASVSNSTTGDEELWQFASNDLGASCTVVHADQVNIGGVPVDALRADVAATADGRFFVSLVQDSGSVQLPTGVLLPSAFDNISEVGALFTISPGYSIPGAYEILPSICLADDGALYLHVIGQNNTALTSPIGEVAVSYDSGETWERLGRDEAGTTDGRWFNSGNDAAHPWNIRTTWHKGSVYMAHNAAKRAATTTNQCSAYGMRVGRYSNVTLPSVDLFTDRSNGLAWNTSWISIGSPAGAGFTPSGLGSDGFNAAGYWEASDTNARYYRATPTTTHATGVIAELRGVERTAGTGTGSFEVSYTFGLFDYGVTLTIGSTLSGTDNNAAGIGSPVAISGAIDIRVALAGGVVSIWYKSSTAGGVDDWTAWLSNTSLTNGGGGGTDRVGFGIDAGSSVTMQWEGCFYAASGDYAENQAGGFTNPDDLRGHPLTGSWSDLGDGMLVRAVGGPSVSGDTYDIETEHDYPIEHQDVLRHPSPAQGWQGEAVSPWVAAAKSLAYTLDDYDGLIGGSGLLGWVLMGCNVPEVRISYYDAGWFTIATVDRTVSFAYDRSGAFVTPADSGTDVDGPWFARDELAGGWWYDGSADMRKIAGNTGGYLTSGATHAQARCRIRLEGVDDTEGATGTGWVLPPNSVILMHDATSRNAAAKLRITYDPNATMPAPPEGRMVAGISSPGEVLVWGVDPSDTRRRQIRPGNELTERRDGRRRSVVYAPPRETRSISWTEGVDTTYTHTTTGDDYVSSTSTSGARPVADRRSVPHELAGLIRELNGSHRVVVDLPSIPTGTPDAVHLTMSRKGGAMLCRFTGDTPMETLIGDEMDSEVIRCSVVAEEEI